MCESYYNMSFLLCITTRSILASLIPPSLALIPAVYWLTPIHAERGYFGGTWWQWSRPFHAMLFMHAALTNTRSGMYMSTALGVVNYAIRTTPSYVP